MNKKQKKYLDTSIKMNKALIELLEKKKIEDVTVKEITEKAGVNRSTFYLHYENINDLLIETTQYITEGFLSYFVVDKDKLNINFDNAELKDLFFITPEYVFAYLRYIKENRGIFRLVIAQLKTLNFYGVYEKLYENIFNPILERYGFSEIEKRYVIKFYLTGITAIAEEWLENDCQDSLEIIYGVIVK